MFEHVVGAAQNLLLDLNLSKPYTISGLGEDPPPSERNLEHAYQLERQVNVFSVF